MNETEEEKEMREFSEAAKDRELFFVMNPWHYRALKEYGMLEDYRGVWIVSKYLPSNKVYSVAPNS